MVNPSYTRLSLEGSSVGRVSDVLYHPIYLFAEQGREEESGNLWRGVFGSYGRGMARPLPDNYARDQPTSHTVWSY